jgi:hypothetical protein
MRMPTPRWQARRVRRIERVCYLIGAALIVAGLFHLVVFAVDGGPWEGPVSWRKPVTFGLSFGLTLITVAWVTSYVRIGDRTRTVLLAIFAVDCVVEVAGITVQAWRHVPSHFNMETATNRSVAMMLAVGGGVLIAVLVTFAIPALRGNPAERTPGSSRERSLASPSMDLAVRAGFATMLIALASGAAMIARGVTVVNTGHQDDAYRTGGFLKPVHGVSLHGLLVLPALAWLLDRAGWPEPRRLRAVRLAVAAYAAAIVVALVISLVGNVDV